MRVNGSGFHTVLLEEKLISRAHHIPHLKSDNISLCKLANTKSKYNKPTFRRSLKMRSIQTFATGYEYVLFDCFIQYNEIRNKVSKHDLYIKF